MILTLLVERRVQLIEFIINRDTSIVLYFLEKERLAELALRKNLLIAPVSTKTLDQIAVLKYKFS